MITDWGASPRGVAKPKRDLSADQLREIADRLKEQAEEYYALADGVGSDPEVRNSKRYEAAVAKYHGKV